MGSAPSDGTAGPLSAFKILIAGGFGAGKTTLVSAIIEVRLLRTEEAPTSVSASHDDLQGVENKTAATVAMGFGRITLGGRRVRYLRDAWPGALLVHVGRPVLRRARGRGAG